MDDLQCCNFSMIGLFSSEMNANMFNIFCKVKKCNVKLHFDSS